MEYNLQISFVVEEELSVLTDKQVTYLLSNLGKTLEQKAIVVKSLKLHKTLQPSTNGIWDFCKSKMFNTRIGGRH